MPRAAALLAAALLVASAAPSAVNDAVLAGAAAPATLAETGLFLDDGAARPNARVVRYGLATPLFSDHADKARFLYVPEGKTARYAGEGLLDIPVGSVLIKHFGFARANGSLDLIETRLLVHQADGWKAWPYVWNADDSAATLKRAGARVAVTGHDGAGKPLALDWQVPNVNQCKGCHAAGDALVPIGPKARNLNHDFQGENNLARLSRLGLVSGVPENAPRLPDWKDGGESLEHRARAYLDVNCGHCHKPDGPASNSGLFLTWETPSGPNIGIGKGPVAAGRGSGGRMVSIDPGHPDRSILTYRMESTEPGVMMPELGRTQPDEAGTALVRAWITAMR
ncbi:SO2930 family diheme c-type cytochrome [Sphingosinicella sp.]|uniref:SO2930 family diheme c-type cytochrome n=1 Tax=Sphingosinicella sp. TaxID=1917971 RepID=UPI00261672C3|nr:SO2930 family diheme c-type cytochrome [Sphingosinicella sp.]